MFGPEKKTAHMPRPRMRPRKSKTKSTRKSKSKSKPKSTPGRTRKKTQKMVTWADQLLHPDPPKETKKKSYADKQREKRAWKASLRESVMQNAHDMRLYARSVLKAHHKHGFPLSRSELESYANMARTRTGLLPLAYNEHGMPILQPTKSTIVKDWNSYGIEPLPELYMPDSSVFQRSIRKLRTKAKKHKDRI